MSYRVPKSEWKEILCEWGGLGMCFALDLTNISASDFDTNESFQLSLNLHKPKGDIRPSSYFVQVELFGLRSKVERYG